MRNFSKKVKGIAAVFACVLALSPATGVLGCGNTDGYNVLQEWQEGQIISDCTGKQMLITGITEDGSFSAREIRAGNIVYATHEHKYEQYSEAIFKKNKVSIKPAICYYKVYEIVYQCTICKQKTSVENSIPQSHNYQSNKCTICGRIKN